ncbi:MAG: replication-associated recombination protein A [Ilumatobacteraceae bacterium]
MPDHPDLFAALAAERLAGRAPLAARVRPISLDEVVGQGHLCAPGAPLRRLIEADAVSSIILWGPPGTGKTTLAELVASTTRRAFERLSAVTAGVKDVREVIDRAQARLAADGRSTVVFVDEIHRFTSVQQDALLHAVETGLVSLVGATTENPAFSVNPALRSRSSVFALKPVTAVDVARVMRRAASVQGIVADDEAVAVIAERCTGDVRQALGALEVAAAVAGESVVGVEHAVAALDTAVSRLGRDDHYDVVSAFIKSMRASETDVALHWLARMLEAGEDPRFVARRMMIFASEDVGEADPTALTVAVSAAEALDRVGLPEATLNLAQAVVHLSQAPKSRAVTDAIAAALEDVRAGRTGAAPSTTALPVSWRPLGFDVPDYYGDAEDGQRP